MVQTVNIPLFSSHFAWPTFSFTQPQKTTKKRCFKAFKLHLDAKFVLNREVRDYWGCKARCHIQGTITFDFVRYDSIDKRNVCEPTSIYSVFILTSLSIVALIWAGSVDEVCLPLVYKRCRKVNDFVVKRSKDADARSQDRRSNGDIYWPVQVTAAHFGMIHSFLVLKRGNKPACIT